MTKTFKPFKYPFAYEAFMASEQMHWLHTEVPMAEDVKDYNQKLSASEKNFLIHILRFFTQGDLDVGEAYRVVYQNTFTEPEVNMMIASFQGREALHVAAYSHLVETLDLPETTYNQFLDYEAMRAKHEYIGHVKTNVGSPMTDLAIFSGLIEGMQLFSSFVMLLNFARHGKMRGMGQIISWSIADETLHTESMIKLMREKAKEKGGLIDSEKKIIYTAAEELVALEDKFIDLAFEQGPMEDLTADQVKKYIRYIADRRLIAMGLKGIFGVKRNPLPWLAGVINAPGHTNFFEQKSTDYAKGAMKGSWNDVWNNTPDKS